MPSTIHLRAAEEKQSDFCRCTFTNKVTLWAASYSACVVYTKTIIRGSANIRHYSPPLRWIIVKCPERRTVTGLFANHEHLEGLSPDCGYHRTEIVHLMETEVFWTSWAQLEAFLIYGGLRIPLRMEQKLQLILVRTKTKGLNFPEGHSRLPLGYDGI